jgi:hypothetical protein
MHVTPGDQEEERMSEDHERQRRRESGEHQASDAPVSAGARAFPSASAALCDTFDSHDIPPTGQAIEHIMRRAEELGLDPHRVAIALDHADPEPAGHGAGEEAQRRPGAGSTLTRLLTRRTWPRRVTSRSS